MMIVFIVLLNLDSLSFYCANRQHEKQRVFDFYAHATRDQQRLRQLLFARFYDQTNVSWHWDWADWRWAQILADSTLQQTPNTHRLTHTLTRNAPERTIHRWKFFWFWWLYLSWNWRNFIRKISTFSIHHQIRISLWWKALNAHSNEVQHSFSLNSSLRNSFTQSNCFTSSIDKWSIYWMELPPIVNSMRRQINRFIHNSMQQNDSWYQCYKWLFK